MRIVTALRYDLSNRIGSGHLVRLISISRELKKRGIPFIFVGAASKNELARKFYISPEHSHAIQPGDQERDWLRQFPEINHVIIDMCHEHRKNSGEVVKELKQERPITAAVIDSISPDHFEEFRKWEPDFIVTPYFHAHRHRPVPGTKNWLTGAKYSLIASEYRNLRLKIENQKHETEQNLLVCFGASDPYQLTERIIQKFIDLGTLAIRTKVVLGSLFGQSRIKKLKGMKQRSGLGVEFVDGKGGLGNHLENCTFVIARAGLIRYEAACLGKNMFLVLEHTRHEFYFREFEANNIGKIYFLDQPQDNERFNRLLESLTVPDKVATYSKFNGEGFEIVDGLGMVRFLNKIFDE